MPLLTTTIGAYPKPDYVPIIDWFKPGLMECSEATVSYEENLQGMGETAEEIFVRAAQDVITDQVDAGVDVPTDGEVRRENYIHYHCRHLKGFDFDTLTHRSLRQGALEVDLPSIVGPVKAKDPFLPHDWKAAQKATDKPVKVTLPGPMTITDTTADLFYDDKARLGRDLADALNQEILALVDAGCQQVQVDEPVFARYPQNALDYGVENLERCWQGVPDHVTKTMHMCCGYPNYLDQTDYLKADPQSYFDIARAVDESRTDVVSLEDAHRHNDLALLDHFQNTIIAFGAITIANSRVETVDEVRARLSAALDHLPAERLIAAPDCGLGFLPRALAIEKLTVLCQAAKSV
ncbi:MAG: cobalamin-independent methionine synthase II family protein [Pseudomonadota bacterium]